MRTKWNWCLFVGGLCCINALLWLSFHPIPWWPIAISATIGVILVTIGTRQRQKEWKEIIAGEIPVSDKVASSTNYSDWIAICESSGCYFFTSRMVASGIEEAKKIALERHGRMNPNNFLYKECHRCSSPSIIVGHVPDK